MFFCRLVRVRDTSGLVDAVNEFESTRDVGLLSDEYEAYLDLIEAKTETIYNIANEARSKGMDFKTEVEIPRAKDLASRTVSRNIHGLSSLKACKLCKYNNLQLETSEVLQVNVREWR